MTIKKSTIENGVETCNTCGRQVNDPYRYKNSKGEVRGCVSACHDRHVGHNANPNWMDREKWVLPKWVRKAQIDIAKLRGKREAYE